MHYDGYMASKTSGCAVDGCERTHYAKGWCQGHYMRVGRSGEAGDLFPVRQKAEKESNRNCKHPDGCDLLAESKGWCGLHYGRLTKTGDVGGLIKSVRTCDLEDCDKVHYGRGLCRMHYRRAYEKNAFRKKAYGDAGPAEKLRTPQAQKGTCSVKGCRNKPRTNQLCDKHHGRMQRYGTTDLIEIEEICRYCGSIFHFDRTGTNTGSLYCSDDCRKYAKTQRSRLRQAKVSAPFINWKMIAERDKWLCGICGKKVNPETTPRTPEYPSVDHIKALARGGEHSIDNVQLAHTGCNARKRDS